MDEQKLKVMFIIMESKELYREVVYKWDKYLLNITMCLF